jgi:hypothetical protein
MLSPTAVIMPPLVADPILTTSILSAECDAVCDFGTDAEELMFHQLPSDLGRQLTRIQHDDLVPFGTHHAGVAQLAKYPDHDLPHRAHLSGQLLLAQPCHQGAIPTLIDGDVEQAPGYPLTNR